ncbi:S-layer homology domain-containing protein [Paenibacillus sp. MDMC362]|uniref:S-layer homology domain-containing protein n=1 Tax=Paenibacillus sp. MDMC362 TaxID=2977365 RepID=UPI000DC2E728|nr:S-layer homology domain-containing protein [Paenibacillus sp. MDMC362]RAR38982.1 S-layer homology domain-containing protein [Paenibacillus sp. MDMC362]
MKTYSNKLAAIMVAAALGTASLPLQVLQVEAAGAPLAVQDIEQATQVLSQLRVMQGYQDGSMGITSTITRAELAKMLVLAIGPEGKGETEPSFTDVNPNAWYERYASELVAQDIMQAPGGRFDPRGTVTHAELVHMVSKALKRDAKSVDYWAKRFYSEDGQATRGQAAYLISIAHEAVASEKAKITSVRALNAITLIVTFDAPLTADNEAFAKAKEDFKFNNGLELTNMPRLKTGSISTYIVPTSVQKPGTSYSLTYKGKTAGTFTGNSTKLDMTEVRQAAQDTFELEALKANGVVDYGYVISAYSGGRGDNAFVLDENNSADGKVYQIISSGQGREVTITPAGGQPIVAKYVPFTQSTDGKQEPKFRLPEGQALTPGVTYTVTSDWAQIGNPTFVAKSFEPLDIIGAAAISESSVSITLSEDPGDELFSGRSVELIDTEGGKLMATYKYSSRKGAIGVFDLTQEGKLKAGTTYTIQPVGKWADETKAVLTVN